MAFKQIKANENEDISTPRGETMEGVVTSEKPQTKSFKTLSLRLDKDLHDRLLSYMRTEAKFGESQTYCLNAALDVWLKNKGF